MSLANLSSRPQPAPERRGGVALPPTPEQIAAQTDLGITLTLNLWPALSLATTHSWGGPLSAQKRDWFAGAVSDLLAQYPQHAHDADYVAAFLAQVMADEFEVVVEDGSTEEVAGRIVAVRRECGRGEFGAVRAMWERWRGGLREGVWVDGGEGSAGDTDTDGEGEGEGDDGEWNGIEDEEDGDVEMGEAPEVVKVPKEKLLPEVDEEGFTKVVGKKRR